MIKKLSLSKEGNYKYNVSLGSQNSNIWTFQFDITEYSGEKHSHTVDIDINAEDIE